MLENKGVGEGMGASKNFGHDKKGSTFLMSVTVAIVSVVVFLVFLDLLISVAVSSLIGQVVDQLLEIPIGAWATVIISYTYITYCPSSITPPSGESNQWIPPPAYRTQQPGMLTDGSPARFCSSCGSQLGSDAKFCPSCGRPV